MSNIAVAGFISMAQLPIVFLFATKNSIVSFLLGPGVGYEKLNFLHRWSGRVMFFAALLHGALWINVLLKRGKPILGEKDETTGIVAFAFLALIVLISLRPGRKFIYQTFFSLQWGSLLSFLSKSA
jgi:ferric-chelate reductase